VGCLNGADELPKDVWIACEYAGAVRTDEEEMDAGYIPDRNHELLPFPHSSTNVFSVTFGEKKQTRRTIVLAYGGQS
jgi:hypothetical protein